MWKRDNSQPSSPETIPAPTPAADIPNPVVRSDYSVDKAMVNIGKSVIIKGELNGSENLTVEGKVEGKIDLKNHVLTIGPNGRIHAHIFAKAVVVQGQVTGNITATERVTIRESGSVEGDIQTPRFAIAEGGMFRGKVDMENEHGAAARAAIKAQPEASLKTLERTLAVAGAAAEA